MYRINIVIICASNLRNDDYIDQYNHDSWVLKYSSFGMNLFINIAIIRASNLRYDDNIERYVKPMEKLINVKRKL